MRQLPGALQSMPMNGMLDAGINVHELTHALQDQHFHIGERDLALRDDTDANLAYHAVIEGEASLVGQLLGLLVIFIGSALTLQLIHDIWPKWEI